MDSGCTAHMCGDDTLTNFDDSTIGKVNLASKSSIDIKGKGSISLISDFDGKTKNVIINDALHVPELRTNLLSVGKLCDKGFKVIFEADSATVIDQDLTATLRADRHRNGLYYLRTTTFKDDVNPESPNETSAELSSAEIWHRKMGHLNYRDLMKCHRDGTVRGMKLEKCHEIITCTICAQGKMTKAPFPKRSERSSDILEIVHSDVCGPMRTESIGKSKYFVTFIDDASRWCEVRFVRHKGEVLQIFKEYKAFVENQTGKKIKNLQSDNGKEYMNDEFDSFLKENGIGRRLTVTHTPEQNGIAERKNRTLLDTTRCLMLQSSLPTYLWAEAVNTANYILNRCPTSCHNGRTNFEVWKGQVPDASNFQEFGREVMTLKREPHKDKFEARSRRDFFVGYSETSKGYRIWLPEERKVEIARDVKFIDKAASSSNTIDRNNITSPEEYESENEEVEFFIEKSPNEVNIEEIPAAAIEDSSDSDNYSDAVERKNIQVEQTRGRGRPRILRTGLRGRPRKVHQQANQADFLEEIAYLSEIPIQKAIEGPNADEWHDAIACELKSILKNDTWTLVPRPDNAKTIDSRVVLRNKYKQDGTLDRRKARLVAKGFAQRPGIDFDSTFAPVARIESIRIMMALAVEKDMIVEQLDVTTAYLNGTLQEKIYMEVPKHIEKGLIKIAQTSKSGQLRRKASETLRELKTENKVCLLNKAIYGLRQAGRCWNIRLCQTLLEYGAKKSLSDPCVFFKGQGRRLLLISTYVDDILIASQDKTEISRIKEYLSDKFEIKKLGPIKYCLGIEFHQNKESITMKQNGYIRDLLDRFGMTDANPVASPLEPGLKLGAASDEDDGHEALPYRELIGSLMYLAICTRPDISFAVSYLSQYNTCFNSSHWTAAKRVLRYLKGSSNLGISYKKTGKPVEGYVDADWANCPIDRRSYTGYAFLLSGSPVAWESRKQRTVALSSTESEYMALTEATKQATYLRNFLLQIGFPETANIKIYCDNNSARKLAENPVYHSRTKHIDVRHHYVREALDQGILTVEHVPTTEMASDMLTKSVPAPKLKKCLGILGLSE